MTNFSALSTQPLSSYVEYYTRLPAIACLLEFVEMLRNPLHIGVEFLCLLIDRRTDQTRAQ